MAVKGFMQVGKKALEVESFSQDQTVEQLQTSAVEDFIMEKHGMKKVGPNLKAQASPEKLLPSWGKSNELNGN